MKRDPIAKLFIIYILCAFALIGCAMCFSSCEVFKHKSTRNLDSTGVTTIDSGEIKKKESGHVSSSAKSNITEWDWWRMTQHFGRDTTIINNYLQGPQPSVVVMEGGKGSQITNEERRDSSWKNEMEERWFARFDSLRLLLSEREKEKHVESKGLGLFAVLGIALGVVALGKVLGQFTIVKRK